MFQEFQVFYTYVASISSRLHVFSWCFRRMLQVFQLFQIYFILDVAKVNMHPQRTSTDEAGHWTHVRAGGLEGGAGTGRHSWERRSAGEMERRGAVPPVWANPVYSRTCSRLGTIRRYRFRSDVRALASMEKKDGRDLIVGVEFSAGHPPPTPRASFILDSSLRVQHMQLTPTPTQNVVLCVPVCVTGTL
jgi:hypothetical protein